MPEAIYLDSEWRGILTQFATKGAEQARIAQSALFRVENGLKAQKGEFSTLVDGAIVAARRQAEKELRAKVDADPELARQYGGAWDGIAKAVERQRLIRERYNFGETGQGLAGKLFGHARTLVRHAAEAEKPDQERLPEFTAAQFPGVRQALLAPDPIYPDFEKLELTFSLTKMREVLGPDDPFVKQVLGQKSPAALAAALVDGTSLADPAARARLLAADGATIAASRDPMIALALRVDPDARAIRKEFEDTVNAPKTRFSGQIAAALFKLYGTATYPDATFTLRISYGTVKGYRIGARDIAPITTIAGLYDRATGYAPFRLPESWIKARPLLDPKQPFNFVSTNDIIGGNSGSPIINPAGEVVGLIFDGNIQSLGGNFGFDGAVNRATSVNDCLLRMGLDKVYHAERIVKELAE